MIKVIAVLSIVGVLFAASGVLLVSAADAAAPGDALYGVDRSLESLRLRLALSQPLQEQLKRLFLEERLQEAQLLLERGDPQALEQAVHEIEAALGVEPAVETPPETDTPSDLGAYCDGTAGKPHPAAQTLAARLGVEYSAIMEWACQGLGFGDIKQAYQISQASGVPVEELFARFSAGEGWGEIRQSYSLQPGTPEVAETETPPEDGEDGDEVDGEGEDTGKQPRENPLCSGAATKNHPAAEKLAQQWGVSYDDIMKQYCAGLGFGEVSLAYQISQASGVSVDEIVALRLSGQGWGLIMQAYNLTGKSKAKPNKPSKTQQPGVGKPPKPPKPPKPVKTPPPKKP